jgi:NAD(P)H-hydrate epimerase
MKVVAADTMAEIDSRTIAEYGIAGLQLMEHAGSSCVDEIVACFPGAGRCVVLAGKGNNGGDGYVIARLLNLKGWYVKVICLAERDQISGDAALNLKRLSGSVTYFCTDEDTLANLYRDEIMHADILVDALLGTGLNSTVSGIYHNAIELMNVSGLPIVAVDIPSGIHGTTGRVQGTAVKADCTVTFALAKLGHVLYPGAEYSGRLVIADIGIPLRITADAPGCIFLTEEEVRPMVRHRSRGAHKGTFGHCLIVAGSPGKTGAAVLSTNSAVRAGSGLVSVAVAAAIHTVLEIKTTEAMTVAIPDGGSGCLTSGAVPSLEKLLVGKDAVALGPGIGRHPETASLVHLLVESVSLPLVVDADGLNALAEDISVLPRKKSPLMVLTPHPGEMTRLTGLSIADIEADRISVARKFAGDNGVFLILKGARTVIASPTGRVAINGSGNPGMASGGMGDVLTGIIVSLLGQGYSGWDACCLGVYLHGYAADMVADEKGEIGITASDVLEMLPYAYTKLLEQPALIH